MNAKRVKETFDSHKRTSQEIDVIDVRKIFGFNLWPYSFIDKRSHLTGNWATNKEKSDEKTHLENMKSRYLDVFACVLQKILNLNIRSKHALCIVTKELIIARFLT